MRESIKALAAATLLLLSSIATAATNDVEIWANQTIDAAASGALLIASGPIATGGNTAATLVVVFHSFDPAVGSYQVRAVIEGQMAGFWYPLVADADTIRGIDDAPTRVLSVSPSNPAKRVTELTAVGQSIISRKTYGKAELPDTIRIALYWTDNSATAGQLISTNVSATLRWDK